MDFAGGFCMEEMSQGQCSATVAQPLGPALLIVFREIFYFCLWRDGLGRFLDEIAEMTEVK